MIVISYCKLVKLYCFKSLCFLKINLNKNIETCRSKKYLSITLRLFEIFVYNLIISYKYRYFC